MSGAISGPVDAQQLAARIARRQRSQRAEGIQRFERDPRVVVARREAQRGQHLQRHRPRAERERARR